MQKQLGTSKCVAAASQCMIVMVRSYKLLLSKKAKRMHLMEECSLIDGGLVNYLFFFNWDNSSDWLIGNTRVISQTALEHFRTSLNNSVNDPYSVLLRRNKLPMGFIDDAVNPHTQKVSHIFNPC